MNNILNNLGYTTYYSGTPEDIVKSEKIYLIRRIDNLSLSNLRQVFQNILKDSDNFSVPEYLESERCFFLNTQDSSCIDNFDTIIYLNSDGPVGYTKFYDDQYTKCIFRNNEVYYINSIKIYTDFNITSSYIDVKLNNSLVKIRVEDEDSSKELIKEDKTYNFTSIPKIIESLNNSDNYIRYTSNIYQAIKDPKKMCVTTDCISFFSENIYQYYINDFNIQRNPHLLDKIQYGIYKDNLYLYQWNDLNEFSIICLSNINKYGNPKVILKSSEEISKILSGEDNDFKIETFGYKYILLTNEKGERRIYSTGIEENDDNFIIPIETNIGVIIDPMNETGEIIYVDQEEALPASIKSPKINQEICGIFLDVRKKSRDYYLYGKIGSWFIFKSTINDLTIYSNINGTLTISGDVTETPIIINDRCILIQDEIECKFFFFEGTSHKCAKKNNNFNENVIIVPNKEGKLHQLIEGFRHAPIGNSVNLPKIVCSILGTLYYIEDNKFKHL